MKHLLSAITLLIGILLISCGSKESTTTATQSAVMTNSADSMSYVMGLNLGKNLVGIDSLLNIDMVCEGLRDAYAHKQRFNDEEARMAFLKYMNYDEAIKLYDPEKLTDGFNTLENGEEIFYISNPALGLWACNNK